jgi:triosephosphate isomerase
MLFRERMTRQPLIAANWKMNLGTVVDALGMVRAIRPALSRIDTVETVICPPFTVLAELAPVLAGSPIELGAQNVHWASSGAHTGEISPAMLAGLCRYVVIGHSERRATRSEAELDEAVNRKVHASLGAGLAPIVCVGETLDQHEDGETQRVVAAQVEAAFDGVAPNHATSCVVAYEPVWAIGSGRSAGPADANRVMGLTIRGHLAGRYGRATSESMRVLYGGSVTSANIAGFMAMPDIDGALVGGASLDPEEFVELVRKASARH